jgi:hypothetical protein
MTDNDNPEIAEPGRHELILPPWVRVCVAGFALLFAAQGVWLGVLGRGGSWPLWLLSGFVIVLAAALGAAAARGRLSALEYVLYDLLGLS